MGVVNLPFSYTVDSAESGGARLVVQMELAQPAAPGVPGEEQSA
jgi:hypothetical protein